MLLLHFLSDFTILYYLKGIRLKNQRRNMKFQRLPDKNREIAVRKISDSKNTFTKYTKLIFQKT